MQMSYPHVSRTRAPFLALSLATLVLIAAGCASAGETTSEETPAPDAAPTVTEEIPEGANRIVMDRQEITEELTSDAPGLAFYVDARQHLELNGFTIETADDEELFLITEPMAVSDGLAVRMNINIDPAPGGSRLIGLVEYANSPAASAGAWQAASWTDGPAREAFSAAVDIMRELSASEFGTATE